MRPVETQGQVWVLRVCFFLPQVQKTLSVLFRDIVISLSLGEQKKKILAKASVAF